MKIISSRASQRSNDQRQDNRTPRAQQPRGNGRALSQPVAHTSARGPSASNGTTPSYAQPTNASRLRHFTSTSPNTVAITPKKSVSSTTPLEPNTSTSSGDMDPFIPKVRVPVAGAVRINGWDAIYKNGQIKVMTFGFIKPTASHENHVAARRQETTDPKLFKSEWHATGTWDWEPPATGTPSVEHQPDSTISTEMTEAEQIAESENRIALAARTGLSDKHFITGLACYVYINHDVLYKILTEALRVARQCVWRWFSAHRPGFFKYSSDIDLARDRFTNVIMVMPDRVRKSADGLIELRNSLCHFNGYDVPVSRVDIYVRHVHQFAVRLLDEEGAQAAKGVRDELRAETEKTVDEIVKRMTLTACAMTGADDGIPWGQHHLDTVWDAVNNLDRHANGLGHSGLDAAAREWARHHMQRDGPEPEGQTDTRGGSPRAVGTGVGYQF
ncbi:hypothetical protein KVR01_009113 [Diaporthe batatas]|uniref:uncharacterized protein n=1 Tax=Diaporthe batatas TaxID=748121 RepID=UPI001D0458D7|nr:uncharacterized protein KVR01_009113 [Diaporthe batatas]KAG8160849.1 hypothetical protein KVR01_009113 [Diaporthe batatas]